MQARFGKKKLRKVGRKFGAWNFLRSDLVAFIAQDDNARGLGKRKLRLQGLRKRIEVKRVEIMRAYQTYPASHAIVARTSASLNAFLCALRSSLGGCNPDAYKRAYMGQVIKALKEGYSCSGSRARLLYSLKPSTPSRRKTSRPLVWESILTRTLSDSMKCRESTNKLSWTNSPLDSSSIPSSLHNSFSTSAILIQLLAQGSHGERRRELGVSILWTQALLLVSGYNAQDDKPIGSTPFPAQSLSVGGSMPEALKLIAASHAASSSSAAAFASGGGEQAGGEASKKLPTIIYSSRTHGQLAQYDRNRAWAASVDSVPDIEELVTHGRNHKLCPFYMSRELCKDADIVFLPYNYLLDANTRQTLVEQVNWDNAVMIFDEAHNVEGVCSDSTSFELTAKHLTEWPKMLPGAAGEGHYFDPGWAIGKQRQLSHALHKIWSSFGAKDVCLEQLEKGSYFDPGVEPSENNVNYRQLAQDLELLRKILKMVENGLHGLMDKAPKDGITRPGAYLFEFFKSFNITSDTLPIINGSIDNANKVLQESAVEMGQSGQAMRTHTASLQYLQKSLNLAFSTTDPISNKPGAPPIHKGTGARENGEVLGSGKARLPIIFVASGVLPGIGMAFRMLTTT
eukprot:gene16620-22867_t